MFTGIVQTLAPVSQVELDQGLARLGIELGSLTSGLELGASVAVNGTCLTVTRTDGDTAFFEALAIDSDNYESTPGQTARSRVATLSSLSRQHVAKAMAGGADSALGGSDEV